MALSYSRLLCCQNLGMCKSPSIFTPRFVAIPSTVSKCMTTQIETYTQKNERLNRPMSPHLTIYKPQLTTILSITHRGTGIALSLYALGIGAAGLFIPGGMLSMIQTIDVMCPPAVFLFIGKYAIAWPALFHYFNGIRHLAWDLGQLLRIKQVYTTGWTVIAISTIATLALAAIF
ncbi:succinate dehydrogenase cytochrome b560 subunit, mitochondrial-like [Aphidius gifuensis]|nr:succinate dehydrogenase cytochrome b560 subunit, mitochondrial-like [Aphidius gifuensis]XP_044019167.1 succinate dehydrogenase cytochrome b560 subunit, mitochondrial-like [Aphidius gifuensis]